MAPPKSLAPLAQGGVLVAILLAIALTGCPGSLEDPQRFEDASIDAPDAAPTDTADAATSD